MDDTSQPTTKPPRRGIFIFIILLLLAGSFRLGYTSGQKGLTVEPKTFKIVNKGDAPAELNYALLWDTIRVLNEKFIDKPVNEQKVLYGAVKGAVAATGDPYTEFFTPEELESFKTDLKGIFDGIGAEIGKRNGNIVIVAPLEGSPAKTAGLRPQDVILKVNGELTAEWSVEQAVQKIRGPKGTKVTLSIFREGFAQPQDFEITRATIEVKSVKWEVKTVGDKSIGIITLSRFGDDTKALFEQAARAIKSRNVHGVVLDLRSNPGGYLDTAVQVASYWLPKGTLVVTEAASSGKNTVFESQGYHLFGGVKTVTLINGGSASASEIVAGALSDHKVTTLIGEKSFGKGSVQEVVDLPGSSALKVTIAKWITPGGRNLNKDGLKPDVEVKVSEEDIKSEKDPQMDRALEEVAK